MIAGALLQHVPGCEDGEPPFSQEMIGGGKVNHSFLVRTRRGRFMTVDWQNRHCHGAEAGERQQRDHGLVPVRELHGDRVEVKHSEEYVAVNDERVADAEAAGCEGGTTAP